MEKSLSLSDVRERLGVAQVGMRVHEPDLAAKVGGGLRALKQLLQSAVIGHRAVKQTHAVRCAQVLLDEFQVLPIAAGDATAGEVAAALECVWGNEETLIVVSSDLSHYLEYAAARSVDASTAQSILNCSTELGGEQACGCVGINGLMHVARERELEVRLLDLRNSGDTAAELARVVGYGAFALYEARVGRQAAPLGFDGAENKWSSGRT